MAKFRYIYRTADRRRLEAEIEADSRDAVFEALRGQGIRPIKVVAEDGTKANGVPPRRVPWGWVTVCAVLALASTVGISVAILAERSDGSGDGIAASRQEAALSLATPLARQTIPGDRMRIIAAEKIAFLTATEAVLAQFAEPGREFVMPETQPDEADLKNALATPLKFGSDELSEQIDLKRIVTGMKGELRGYLAAGGTWDGYLGELVNRQKLEISYRDNAHRKIHDTLDGDHPDNAKAYDLWLKANAQLQSMGIYPIPLPDALREYQMSVDWEN